MAKFGANVTEAPQTPNFVTPKEGIGREPVAIEGLTNIFKTVRADLANGRAKKGEAFLSDFSNKQLAIIQAIDQGETTSQFGRTRLRTNLMQAISDFPDLREGLLKANGSLLGNAGIGGIVNSGTQDEILRERLRTQLTTDGLLAPDASETDFDKAAESFRQAKEAEAAFAAKLQSIKTQRAEIGLTSDQIDLLDKQESKAAEQFIIETAPAFMLQFVNKADELIAASKGDGSNSGEVVAAIEEEFLAFQQRLSVPLSKTDSFTSEALMKGYQDFKDLTIKRAKGEFTTEAFERQKQRIISRNQVVALGDPTIARAVSISNLYGDNMPFGVSQEVQTRIGEFVTGNLSPSMANANLFSGEGSEVSKYLDTISQDPATLDEAGREEQATHLKSIMSSVRNYADFISSSEEGMGPENAIALVNDWMSSPEFFKLSQEYPEILQNNESAMRVLQTNFFDEVLEMIDTQFTEAGIMSLDPEATKSFIEKDDQLNALKAQLATAPDTAKGQIQARIDEIEEEIRTETGALVPAREVIGVRTTANGSEFFALDPENTEASQEASVLNKRLAPVINRNVRAFSHLNGSNDYAKFWKQMQDRIFEGTDIVQGGVEDTTPDLENFAFPQVSSGGVPEEVANDTEFMSEVARVSDKFEFDPSILLAVMDFETGGTFSPAVRNAAGSGATGLIQFMEETASSLNTTTDQLASLSRAKQMKFVEQYLDQYADSIRGGSAQDVYMAVLFPRAITKSDSFVLFRSGTTAYSQNRGLDTNGDGTITKAEAAAKVVSLVGKHQ